nr:aminotransferase class V-fold PLP-dependent enzyme [Hyphomicrobiales bacterium]
IEKFRHSPQGQTRDASDKLRQMVSATVRAYHPGADTTQHRQQIALDYINSIGKDAIMAHETMLCEHAMERLGTLNSIEIFGRARDKGAIVSFALKGAHAHDVATILDRSGVAVRAGTHCAEPLLARYGQTSTCRASFAVYNTTDEIEALVEALIKAQSFLA